MIVTIGLLLSVAAFSVAEDSKVVEKTGAVTVLNVGQAAGRGVSVTLRNDSAQAITGITLAWTTKPGIRSSVSREFLWLPTGGVFKETVEERPATIEVSAVLFEDGTGKGDSAALDRIRGTRAGYAASVKPALALLREALAKPDPRTELSRVRSRIPGVRAETPTNVVANPGETGDFALGRREGADHLQQDLWLSLEKVETATDARASILELIGRYERMLTRIENPRSDTRGQTPQEAR